MVVMDPTGDTRAGGLTAAAKKLLLRLDNGSLICDSKRIHSQAHNDAILLSVEKAYKAGLLRELNLSKLEQLVTEISNLLPGSEARFATLSGLDSGDKRKRDEQVGEYGEQKRPRNVTTHYGNGTAGDQPSPSAGSHGETSWNPSDFVDKSLEILQKLQEELGDGFKWFAAPVNPLDAPGYHKVVKQPMDCGTILNKLQSGQYSSPREFEEDMKLVWTNCSTYNPKGTPVWKVGFKLNSIFEREWLASGLCSSLRSRRANAGVAAAKYEPELELERKKSVNGKAVSSGKLYKKSSSKPDEHEYPKMSREEMTELAEKLQGLGEAQLQGVLDIIRENSPLTAESDEIELDFDALDDNTLWKLHDFISGKKSIGVAQSKHSSFKIEDSEDSDTDSESDSASDN